MYYTYMLRCVDNSIYTGITTDIDRRFREHIKKRKECAKYTFTHDVVKIEAIWKSENRKSASKLEYWIKTLNKSKKEKLILDNTNFNEYFMDKLNTEEYTRINIKIKEN